MNDSDFLQTKPEYLPEVRGRAHSDRSKAANAIRLPGRNHLGWADVRAMVRVAPPGEETWSMVELTRPHALIGRKPGCDITIAHADLEPIHIYLHFDEKGCYAVDLRTATGMRVNGRALTHGPLAPGDILEAGGFRVMLDGLLINDQPISNEANYGLSPLAQSGLAPLVGLRLKSLSGKGNYWRISSRIAFVGSEPTCAVALTDNPAASRVHGVLVRTESSVFFVDLISKGTHINGDHLFNSCRELFQSDVLAIGRRGFAIDRDDQQYEHDNTEGQQLVHQAAVGGAYAGGRENPDSQAILAGLLSRIQTQHDSAIERQNELQVAMAQLLRQVQSEQSRVLEKHLDRIQKMDTEIADLRKRLTEEPAQTRSLTAPAPSVADLGNAPTLAPGMETDQRPEPAGRPIDTKKVKTLRSESAPESPEYTTAWLMDRVSHLEKEQTSAWRDLLGRMRGK